MNPFSAIWIAATSSRVRPENRLRLAQWLGLRFAGTPNDVYVKHWLVEYHSRNTRHI